MRRFSRLTTLGALLLAPTIAGQAQTLALAEVGRIHVGGILESEDGVGWRESPTTVHYLLPEARRVKAPVVLYPGPPLSPSIFLATPDGREGWAQALLRAGYPVYLIDAPSDRSNGAGRLPADVWARWGLGSAPGEPYPNTRFPVRAVERLYESLSPPLARADAERGADRAALEALLERVGPAVVIAHGDSALHAFEAAAARPGSVRALVGLEPAGCDRAAADLERLAPIPFFAVFGDYIQARGQAANLDACRALAEAFSNVRGGRGELLVLPEDGVFGNTHLLMVDDNSLDVAAQVIRWLDRRVN